MRSAGAAPQQSCSADKGGNDQRVDDIDEEAANEWNDDERPVGGPVLLRDSRHVGDRGGRRSKRDAAETGRYDGRFVAVSYTHLRAHETTE